MKRYIWSKVSLNITAALSLVFFFTCLVFALPGVTEKRLVWDPNQEEDLKCYRVYFRAEIEEYTNDRYDTILAGIEEYSLADIPFNTYMVLTALDIAGNESEFSNEVVYVPFDVVAPAGPSGVRIEDVE